MEPKVSFRFEGNTYEAPYLAVEADAVKLPDGRHVGIRWLEKYPAYAAQAAEIAVVDPAEFAGERDTISGPARPLRGLCIVDAILVEREGEQARTARRMLCALFYPGDSFTMLSVPVKLVNTAPIFEVAGAEIAGIDNAIEALLKRIDELG